MERLDWAPYPEIFEFPCVNSLDVGKVANILGQCTVAEIPAREWRIEGHILCLARVLMELMVDNRQCSVKVVEKIGRAHV